MSHLVLRQEQVVEAGVGGGQATAVGPVARNGEGRPKIAQAIDGHTVAAGDEAEQAPLAGLWQGMGHLPKPPDCLCGMKSAGRENALGSLHICCMDAVTDQVRIHA